MRKVFLDDRRTVDMVYDRTAINDCDVVRSYDEFVDYIKTRGVCLNSLDLTTAMALMQMSKSLPTVNTYTQVFEG